jgi:hypothetical protein
VGFFAKLFQRFPCRISVFSTGYAAEKGFLASRGVFQIFEALAYPASRPKMGFRAKRKTGLNETKSFRQAKSRASLSI